MNRSDTPLVSESLAERFAPWAAGVVLALPVLIARYPPMTDLPYHESVIALLRHRSDPVFSPPGLYRTDNFGHPNQLFYLVGWLVSYLLPSDWTCKVLVAATVIAVAACAGRLATYLGASRFTALAVAPIALGWTFLWGLVTNLTGLAALLFAIPLLDRVAEAPNGKNAAKAIGAMALLYLAHEATMVAACFAVVIFAAAHPLRWKDTAVRLSPAIFASLLYEGQALYQRHLMTPMVRAVPTTFMAFSHKLTTIPGALLGGHDLVMQWATFGLLAASIVGFIIARVKSRRRGLALGVLGTIHRFRFEAFAALSLLLYFVMPYTISGATLVYHRFLPPAFAVFAVAAAPRGASRTLPRIVRFVACVVPLASLLLMWPEFADSNRSYRELDGLLPLIHEGSSVAHMEIGSNANDRVYSAAGGGARALAVHGGRLLYSFADSPISPVQIFPEYQWNESEKRVAFDAYAFRPSFDCDRYRYILAHTPGGSIDRIMERAMLPDAKLLARSGEWMLFESTHETIALLSPDAPLPEPHPTTLRKRMKLAYAEMLKEEEPDVDPAQHPPPAVFDPQDIPDMAGSNGSP